VLSGLCKFNLAYSWITVMTMTVVCGVLCSCICRLCVIECSIIKIIIITKNLFFATKCRCKLSSARLSATVRLRTKQMCLQYTLETQQRDWAIMWFFGKGVPCSRGWVTEAAVPFIASLSRKCALACLFWT